MDQSIPSPIGLQNLLDIPTPHHLPPKNESSENQYSYTLFL